MPSSQKAAAERPVIVDRVNVALVAEAAEALSKIQDRAGGVKKVDIVNRALMLYEFIDAELRQGNQLLLRDPQGRDQLIKIFL